jgi:uncharacterized protein HemY
MDALDKFPVLQMILILIIGLLIVLLFVFAIKGCVSKIGNFSSGANRFIEDVRNGRYNEAYRQMSEAYRLRVKSERFQEAVSSHPNLRMASEGYFRQLKILGGSATLKGVLRTDAGDVSVVFNFSRKEDRWDIDGITIGGLPAVP